MQRVEISRQRSRGGQPLDPLPRMPKPLTEPEAIGLLQTRGAQQLTHFFDPTAAGVGQDRQGLWPLLQARSQGAGITAVQADPSGVLPGARQTREGQLQGAGSRMKPQALGAKALNQQPADAKPEGVSTGQHHGLPLPLKLIE